MSLLEILVIIMCVIIVFSVVITAIIKKKQGKCVCGCNDCPHYYSCHDKNKKEQ